MSVQVAQDFQAGKKNTPHLLYIIQKHPYDIFHVGFR